MKRGESAGYLFIFFAFLMAAETGAQTTGEAEIGLGHLNDRQYRYGRFTGLVEEGPQAWLSFSLQSDPSNDEELSYWYLRGTDLGLDTLRLQGELGYRGTQAFDFDYRELPFYDFADGSTPFLEVSDNLLLLPQNWQVVGDTTQSMVSLDTSLKRFAARSERQRLDLHYQRQLHPAWDLFAEYRHERKEGWRSIAGTIGSTGGNARAALLPSAIDFETDKVELGLRFGNSHSSVVAAYSASFFSNQDQGLYWQNPFGPHPQWAADVGFPAGSGQLALEPNNSMQQFRLSLGHTFTNTTRASAAVSFARLEQDEDFLPYTINPALSVASVLPMKSLDGKVETLSADLRLSSYLGQRVHVVGRYHLDERDNQTPRELFVPVVGDSQNQLDVLSGFYNKPYGYRRQRAALEANYRMRHRIRFKTGYEVVMMERDYSEIESNREYTLTLGVAIQSLENLALNVDYHYQERRGDAYQGNRPLIQSRVPGTVAEDDFENHPLLRKYYLAERQRDRVQARLDWFVTPALSVGFTTAYNRDDYGSERLNEDLDEEDPANDVDLTFGLNQLTLKSHTVDLSYVLGEHWNLSAYYSTEHYRQDQLGRAFTAAPGQADDLTRNWLVNGDDKFSIYNLSIAFTALQRQFSFLQNMGIQGDLNGGLEFSDAQSSSEIKTLVGSALSTAALPDLETRTHFYRLYGSYQWPKLGTISIAFARERFTSSDFALDGVAANTMSNVLSLGQQSPNYTVNWISMSFARRF